MVADIEDTVKRISTHKGVIGVMVATGDTSLPNAAIGMQPVKTTVDNTATLQYVTVAMNVYERAQSMTRELDPTNFVHYIRVRTTKYEIMACVENDHVVVAIQNPHVTE